MWTFTIKTTATRNNAQANIITQNLSLGVEGSEIVFGRGPSCDVNIGSKYCSRVHAKLRINDANELVFYPQKNSTNLLQKLNDRPIQTSPTRLQVGDKLTVFSVPNDETCVVKVESHEEEIPHHVFLSFLDASFLDILETETQQKSVVDPPSPATPIHRIYDLRKRKRVSIPRDAKRHVKYCR